MIEIDQEDKAYIKRVVIEFHGQHIKPADRHMDIVEQPMPWEGLVAYGTPEKWRGGWTN